MNQEKPKQIKATHNQQQWDQFFLTMSTIKQILTITLLTEEALFTWAFQSWVSLDLQEFKVAYQ